MFVRNYYRMMSRFCLCAVCLLAVPVGAAEAASTGSITAITQRMGKFVEESQISGAVTLVAHDGKVVHLSAVGQADVEAKRPMRTDTVFAIASMTKPVTATAVMILQDEGKLCVDDPVSKYIPQFKSVQLDGQPPAREITIRDLMTHTSGVGGGQQNQGTLKKTVELLAGQPLRFQPGAKWQYSPGLTVCGHVIQVAAGQPYEDFLAERIFRPLQMSDTTFFPNDAQRSRLATIYKPGAQQGTIEPATHWLTDLGPARTPNPSGGLFSTAENMARFYQMILGGGQLDGKRIVSEKAVRQMTTVQTPDLTTGFTPGNGWGLGWCVVRQPQGVTAMISPGTFGHGGAFGTQGWVDPNRKMIFVLMIQRTAFGNADGADIRGDFQRLAVEAVTN
jgi:CubicO group peptidase (beta-lactamase class C family)